MVTPDKRSVPQPDFDPAESVSFTGVSEAVAGLLQTSNKHLIQRSLKIREIKYGLARRESRILRRRTGVSSYTEPGRRANASSHRTMAPCPSSTTTRSGRGVTRLRTVTIFFEPSSVSRRRRHTATMPTRFNADRITLAGERVARTALFSCLYKSLPRLNAKR